MTDVFPWLETELRSADAELRAFMMAVAGMGALVRRNVRVRALRRSLDDVRETREGLIRVMFGIDGRSAALNASIAIALLGTLRHSYTGAVESEDLAGYHTSYALSQIATDLLGGVARDASVDLPSLALLTGAFPSVEPPPRLARPEQLTAAITQIWREVEERVGVGAPGSTLDNQLDEVGRLLGDVLESYERGHGPLAARLAASLFVRSYDPIREELGRVAPSCEQAVTRLLGFELRRAINDRLPAAQVAHVGEAIRAELAAAERGKSRGT